MNPKSLIAINNFVLIANFRNRFDKALTKKKFVMPGLILYDEQFGVIITEAGEITAVSNI